MQLAPCTRISNWSIGQLVNYSLLITKLTSRLIAKKGEN